MNTTPTHQPHEGARRRQQHQGGDTAVLEHAPAYLHNAGLPAPVPEADQDAGAEHEPDGVRRGGEGHEGCYVRDLAVGLG